MIVNESAARALFPNQDPLGEEIRFNGRWHRIVGLVTDQRLPGDEAPPPAVYVHDRQLPVPASFLRSVQVVVRTDPGLGPGAVDSLMVALRQTVREIDPALPVADLQSLEERLATSPTFGRPRYLAVLFSAFSSLALFLALLGLASVLTFIVTHRRAEFGLRRALGATPSDLLAHVTRRGLRLVLPGAVLGSFLALASTRALGHLLYGLEGLDPFTFAATFLLLLTAAILASLVPAWRASRVPPNEALRSP